jgi:hypothetical protein
VIVPLLMSWAGLEVRSATATSLAAIGITALAGVATYSALGDVRPGYAALVGLPAAVGAVAGTGLQSRLRACVVTYLFAALLVGVAAWLLVS